MPQLSASQFVAWESDQPHKFELQHGYVLAFAGGTIDHDRMSFNMRTALENRFSLPCRTFGSEVKIRVAPETMYYADAGVTCDGVTGSDLTIEKPRVVCEVLSPSTRSFDLIEKRAAYRAMRSLTAIVFIHTAMRRVEIDRRDSLDAWHTEFVDHRDFEIGNGAIALDAIYALTDLANPTPDFPA